MAYDPPKVLPSDGTFAQLQAGGVSGHLERLIAANAAPNGYTVLDYQLIRAANDGNLEDVYRRLRQLVYDFNEGNPVEHERCLANLKHVHNAFAVLEKLCSELGELIDANPGEISGTHVGGAEPRYKRLWP